MYIFTPKNSNGSSGKKRFKINWRLLRKSILICGGAVLLFIIATFAWFAKDLPSPGNLNERFVVQSTKIYDRTGDHLLYDIHGEEKRTEIPFEQMPESLRYATIALEDQNFYTHLGIQPKSILRAVFKDIFNFGAAQGGSTITQQLIKQSLLTSEKTFTRKIKEVILAIELEQKFSKDEILGMYLNEIPYGSNAYGVEAAAQTFFGKHAQELTLDESAILASLPQAPSRYSPYGTHTENLKARQEYALDQMARLGYITEEQANDAKQVDIFSKIKTFSDNISAPHFVMHIKETLEKKYGAEAVEQGGLKVYTTLDWDKQQIAEEAIKNHSEKDATVYKSNNQALVAMDPNTGQILAMVGSKDYFGKASPVGCISGKNCKFEGNFNVATALRQPGSSFKPYVYLTAFEKGYTPETNLWDVDTNFSTEDGKTYDPKNYDGKNRGLLQMKNSLAMSLNVPAVKTLYLAGVQNSIDTAHKMGITTLNKTADYGLSLVLGGGEVKLLDHVNAFSTFATGGIHHDTVSILKIEDGQGNILEQYKPSDGQRVIEEKYVAMIDYILSTNELRAPVFGDNNLLRFDNRPVAAKTGTTNEWRDGWTMGYTPKLVAGVWAGNNDNSIMAPGADGSYVAAPIWREFMDKALANYNVDQFPKYEKEETGKDVLDGKLEAKREVKVCKIPGSKNDYCLANDNCPSSEVEKKKFSDAHSILYYVKKDDPRGDAPEDPEDDPQFKNWEKAVEKWLEDEKGYSSNSTPTKECKDDDFKKFGPSIDLSSSNGNTSPLIIKISVDAPFGIKKINLSVDGDNVTSSSDSSFEYSYSVPDSKKNSDISIKASVEDKKGNTDSTNISVQTNIL
ncbi:MAG: Penicillin-binding protein, 1A family [Candidatus Moranbacteria bacterium GW2011_GWF2_36_839]|nr:MAG: Penicillin-binding protein, 1A family [Candidatus Moranbacteria bacterium GW2011_GWF1_36_78]KKQ16050.1 MAG: Penicillin-binding protein, 1A family [Candidatus Moranbacteria bacterium GW2011_GWF2_36_839]HAT74358.1 penicillin-binding protein [Candidatus Moranbacteria bacterium]HBY11252.1 penicillin-binding protein [Candidatus Moranbacteria bacterium]